MNHPLEVDGARLLLAATEDGRLDLPLILRWPAPHDGAIFLGELVAELAEAELARSRSGLGHEDDATGFAVEAVEDGDLAAAGEFKRKQLAEVVPKGDGVRGLAGVNVETGRFIEGDPGGRLVEDAERELKVGDIVEFDLCYATIVFATNSPNVRIVFK